MPQKIPSFSLPTRPFTCGDTDLDSGIQIDMMATDSGGKCELELGTRQIDCGGELFAS